jgi:GxxExxY protein
MTREDGTPQEDKPPRRQNAKGVEPSKEHDRVARQVVDSAFAVHHALGPGLLESVYEQYLLWELAARDLVVQRQVAVPVIYRGVRIDAGLRMDLLVGSLVVVEIKAIERLLPVHEAQLLTYLKLSGHSLGILINFTLRASRMGFVASCCRHDLGALAVHWRPEGEVRCHEPCRPRQARDDGAKQRVNTLSRRPRVNAPQGGALILPSAPSINGRLLAVSVEPSS